MKKTGAELVVYALEQLGVKYTFGIPGVHTTELYDALNGSRLIEPILVTHEMGAAFAADAVSRTSDSIGCTVLVPAAGTTHAMSGIGEAYLDGIPLLVITGGIRRDNGRYFQLHQLDQLKLVQAVTKKAYVVHDHSSIVSTIYEAYEKAISGTPGPVLVEIPTELQLFRSEVNSQPKYLPRRLHPPLPKNDIAKAIELLKESKRPGLYLGWGARECWFSSVELANLLNAPVSTTMQGLSVFPGNNPLYVGMGFGKTGTPASEKAFKDCDCLLAVGVRFGELATGSYSLPVPERLIHIDINPEVFHKNYPAKIVIQADAKEAMDAILNGLKSQSFQSKLDARAIRDRIRIEKEKYLEKWVQKRKADKVSPGHFFRALRERLQDGAYIAVDVGNHTFLTAELFPVTQPKHLCQPSDFNAMGYAVPAAIGMKLSHPSSQVVAIVGDGAFLMTGMEILTASRLKLGIVYFVFHDGELGQISQFQKIPLNRKTCTILGEIKLEGVAHATGAVYLAITNDYEIESGIEQAVERAGKNQPVIVDVKIDYSLKTRFSKGVIRSNFNRFPLGEKVRFIKRAVKRHIVG